MGFFDLIRRYQFGQAIGGYLIPPFSELAGRWYPYFVSAAVFSVFCVIIPFSTPTVFIGRFITGVASAVPSVVIAGSVEDLFNTRERVWIVVLWNAATTMALCIGPIYAAYITAFSCWRWVYFSAGIFTGVLGLGLLGIKESRPSVLLKRKIERVREETEITDLRWNNADAASDWKEFTRIVVVRPMQILFTEPLVIAVSIISGVSWGLIYLFTESTINIYQSIGFSKTQASLPFLAVASGVVLTLIPRIWDMKKVDRRQKASEYVEPYVARVYMSIILNLLMTDIAQRGQDRRVFLRCSGPHCWPHLVRLDGPAGSDAPALDRTNTCFGPRWLRSQRDCVHPQRLLGRFISSLQRLCIFGTGLCQGDHLRAYALGVSCHVRQIELKCCWLDFGWYIFAFLHCPMGVL